MPNDKRRAARRNTHPQPQQFRLHPVAQAMSIAACGIALYGALTQQALAQTSSAQPGQALQAARQTYNIPASALAPALRSLASTANLLLTFTEDQTTGQRTGGISGAYTPHAALAALLVGTDLQAVPLDNGGYVLRKAPAGAAAATSTGTSARDSTLPEVRVTAQAERAELTEGTGSYAAGGSSAATGMGLSLRETPQSVSVITRQRMDDQQLHSVVDVFKQTPGLYVLGTSFAMGGLNYVYSRGYQVDSYQIDGIPTAARSITSAARGGSVVDTAIYDSVEVVRGATGLLAGAGDPSASVNLVRKRPTHDFRASLEASVGRWDQRRLMADVGGPLNSAGTLRARVVAAHDRSESWYDHYKGDRQIVYGVLDVDLTEKTLLTLAVQQGREKSNAEENQGLVAVYDDGTPTPYSRHNSDLPVWGYWNEKKTTVSLGLEHRFNADWQFNLNYSKNESTNPVVKKTYITNISSANVATASYVGRYGYDLDNETLDGRLNGLFQLFGRKHQIVAGFNKWSSDRMPSIGPVAIYDPAIMIVNGVPQNIEPDWGKLSNSSTPIYPHKTRQSGLYAATRLNATDDLSLIAGARWTNWRTVGWTLPSGVTRYDRRYSGEFTPYAGLTYQLTKEVSAYGSHTKIFQPQSLQDVSGKLLDPQQGSNKEIGLKGEWFGGRMHGSVAVYETRMDKLPVVDTGKFTPTGGVAYRTEDHVQTRGWELELAGEPVRGWQIQGSYSRSVTRDSAGALLYPERPVHQVKLFSTYALQSVPRLRLGGGVHWQSKIYSTEFDHVGGREYATQNAYAVVNLMASYEISKQLSLNLNLNNVFDKKYRTVPEQHSYGAERNLYATLKYQF